MRVSIIIPTLNAEKDLEKILPVLTDDLKNINHQMIIIDSSSEDRTIEIARKWNAEVIEIKRDEFDHGKTRQKAVDYADGNILVFFTQDAVPLKSAVLHLIRTFDDPQVGVAYGRQLPKPDASPFAMHLRYFNYPPRTVVKSLEDSAVYGMKVAFNSDSFSAYRKSALLEVGGFPETMMAEDVYVAGKIILAGKKSAYVADAEVIHSHNLTLKSLYQRYVGIGCFYKKEHWIEDHFGKNTSEGKRFIISELKYLWKNGYWYLWPLAFIRNGVKWIAYKIGRKQCGRGK